MTVNKVIEVLESMDSDVGLRIFDEFGGMYTSSFWCESWRGSNDKPAICLELIDTVEEATTVEGALDGLRDCDGCEVTGHKGGDYVLDANDTIFLVAHDETSGNSVTIDSISPDGYIRTRSDAY